MSMDINIKYSLRPCMVAIRKGGDERKALLHRFAGPPEESPCFVENR